MYIVFGDIYHSQFMFADRILITDILSVTKMTHNQRNMTIILTNLEVKIETIPVLYNKKIIQFLLSIFSQCFEENT